MSKLYYTGDAGSLQSRIAVLQARILEAPQLLKEMKECLKELKAEKAEEDKYKARVVLLDHLEMREQDRSYLANLQRYYKHPDNWKGSADEKNLFQAYLSSRISEISKDIDLRRDILAKEHGI